MADLEHQGGQDPVSTASSDRASGTDLATLLSELAQSLQQEPGLEATLQGIVDGAVALVPGAEHASMSAFSKRKEAHTRAATGELPRSVDQVQADTGQGPCLDTLYERRTARIPVMADEQRWPDFARRASDLGIGSMLAVQLFVEGDSLGALNLFSRRSDSFDEESEHVALLFASHAAVAISEAQDQQNLQGAIDFRDLIGQAKGILMERHRITSERAFLVLSRASQNSNRALRDVATELVFEGTLDQPDHVRPAAQRG